MDGDLLDLLEGLAKMLFGIIDWFSQRPVDSAGQPLEKPRRMIPCLFWAIGPFLAIGVSHPMNALAAGGIGLGASLLLFIIWDDAPKTVSFLMWAGAMVGLAAIVIWATHTLAHVIPI